MTEVGLKEDNTTHRVAWRNKIIIQLYRRLQMMGQSRYEEDESIFIGKSVWPKDESEGNNDTCHLAA